MEISAKNQIKIAQAVQDEWTIPTIGKMLGERQLVTGMEAIELAKHKPGDMTLDVLYLEWKQVPEELLMEMANAVGQLVEPVMDKAYRDEHVVTPTQVIKRCLQVHGFDNTVPVNGVIVISNQGSEKLNRMYAVEFQILQAKQMAKDMLKNKGAELAVFVESYVAKRFAKTNTVPKASSPTVKGKSVNDILVQLELEMNNLNAFTDTFRYKSPNEVIEFWPVLTERGERIYALVQAVTRKVETMQQETQVEVIALKEKVTQSRATRDALAEEMEGQMAAVQLENENYQTKLVEIQAKISVAEDNNILGSDAETLENLQEEMAKIRRDYSKTVYNNSFKTADLMNQLNGVKFQNGVFQSKLFETEEKLMRIERQKATVDKGREMHNGYLDLKQTILEMKKADEEKKNAERKPKVEAVVEQDYSSDDEAEENQVVPNRPRVTQIDTLPRLASPSKFGMKLWAPLTSTIFQHLQSIKIGISQAKEQKLDNKQIQNLVLMTLPSTHQYVIDFITDTDRTTIESFLNKIVELLEGSKTEQLSNFLKAQRNPTEKILGFFSRMKNLYIHSTGKKESELEDDVFGIRLIYQKCYEAMAHVQQTELQRLADSSITQGTLKFSELLKYIAQAARKIPIESVSLSALDADAPTASTDYRDEGKTKLKCFYCKRVGHIKRNCFKRQNDERRRNDSYSSNKENKDSGNNDGAIDGRPTNHQH